MSTHVAQGLLLVALAVSLAGVCRPASANACSAEAAGCTAAGAKDLVRLRDGQAFCGTILHREPGSYVLIVSENETKTIDAAEIECIAVGPGRLSTTRARQTTPERSVDIPDEGSHSVDLAFEWDLRVVGTTLMKRFTQSHVAAWSWGFGAGVGFGGALHLRPGGGAIDFELGVSGAVTYGTWRAVEGRSVAAVEQDTSLVLGLRLALGRRRSAVEGPGWSDVMLGVAWLPSYVDFYGRDVRSKGTINLAGVRLSLDLGSALGPTLGHSSMLRLVLSFLPYVGSLPTAASFGAGFVFH